MNEIKKKTKLELKKEKLAKLKEQRKITEQSIKDLEKKEERKRNNNNIQAFNLAYKGDINNLIPFLFSGLAKYVELMSKDEINNLIEEGKKVIELNKSGKPILIEQDDNTLIEEGMNEQQ